MDSETMELLIAGGLGAGAHAYLEMNMNPFLSGHSLKTDPNMKDLAITGFAGGALGAAILRTLKPQASLWWLVGSALVGTFAFDFCLYQV